MIELCEGVVRLELEYPSATGATSPNFLQFSDVPIYMFLSTHAQPRYFEGFFKSLLA